MGKSKLFGNFQGLSGSKFPLQVYRQLDRLENQVSFPELHHSVGVSTFDRTEVGRRRHPHDRAASRGPHAQSALVSVLKWREGKGFAYD